MLTLTQAAQEIGLTRSGLFKAIQAGRVSAQKNSRGHFIIDPAELFRVYQPVNKVDADDTRTTTQTETTKEIELLRQLLAQVEGERDDLRRRLDDEAKERRNLTLLLTHKSGESTLGKLMEKVFGN